MSSCRRRPRTSSFNPWSPRIYNLLDAFLYISLSDFVVYLPISLHFCPVLRNLPVVADFLLRPYNTTRQTDLKSSMKVDLVVILFLLIQTLIDAIPIDNGVASEPQVLCHSGSIEIQFLSRNPFGGRLFVKGHSQDVGCFKNFHQIPAHQRLKSNSIQLNFGSCSADKERMANPRGIMFQTTIIIQYHPIFLTKVDRAYKIGCFYMETVKTVSSDFQVSQLTTNQLPDENFPMPICTYSIHRDRFDGPQIQYAQVGDPVFHKWRCVPPNRGAVGTYGMLVHSCYVKDNSGEKVRLVDERGCSLDPYILGHLTYSDDLMMAYREAHIFKFADRNSLLFSCQIRLCLKSMDACKGMSPPKCREIKNKRSTTDLVKLVNRVGVRAETKNDFDVNTNSLLVFDVDEPLPNIADLDITDFSSKILTERASHTICVPHQLWTGLLVSLGSLLLTVGVLISILINKRRKLTKSIKRDYYSENGFMSTKR